MKKVTIKDIAKEAGVSIASVSHVINGTKKISDKTRKKIEDAITKFNYIPDRRATNLRTNSSKAIGLVIPSVPDQYVTGVINGITSQARSAGYHILFLNTDENQVYEREALNLLLEQRVDGIIYTPVDMSSLKDSVEIVNRIPLVQVLRFNDHLITSTITPDDFSAGYIATKHLLEVGYSKVGVIYSRSDIKPTEIRIEGYRKALKEHDISDTNLTIRGYATAEGGYKAALDLLTLHPDINAIFVLNDLMTLGVMKAIKKLNLKCPEEIGLVGFGDFSAAELIEPSISVINVSTEEIGKIAVQELLAHIKGSKKISNNRIPVELIARNSTNKNIDN